MLLRRIFPQNSLAVRFVMQPVVTLVVVAGLSIGLSDCIARGADPVPDAAVGQRLVEMFTAGYGRGASALKTAQQHYQVAQGRAPKDPRVAYGYGLVLLKQLKNKEALEQFEAATSADGPEYWPAWEALVWSHLTAKDYTTGYLRLTEFSRRLAKSKDDLNERQQAAEWVGQVLSALQKIVDTVKQREALLREDETVAEILGPELNPAVARGKATVNAMHALLEGDVQQARAIAEAKAEKERVEREAQNAKDLESSAEKREQLKKNAEDAKKYLEQQLASFDKQLGRLERDYDFLQKRILSLTASQIQLNMESNLLSQQAATISNNTNNNNRNANGALAQAYQQRMAVLEMQGFRYQVELDQTLSSVMAVSQRAQMLIGQRSVIVRQYEKTTGDLVVQDSQLDKWQDRLKKDGEKLKEQPKPKAGPVAHKVQQARSFRTYVELDLTQERDRLLDTFGVAMSAKPEK